MDKLDKLYNDEILPHGKRKERIIEIADNIIKQILKDDSNLLDAQIIAEIVSIGIRDIVDTGITDGKVEPSTQLTKEQEDKLLGDGWTWGKYSHDGYFDASGHPIG
jgi:hypothetical protein